MERPTVHVLLSTYNGEKYLKPLLDSVLQQNYIIVNLFIRDDGSSDSTVSIIKSYINNYPSRVIFLSTSGSSKNLGPKASFLYLLENLKISEGEYIAFCDQDDIWEPNKLFTAFTFLKDFPQQRPALYCSSTKMVDENLTFIKSWPDPPTKEVTLYNVLLENIAVGCTMVFNRATFIAYKDYKPHNVSNIIMHDWWMLIIAATFGNVVFDKDSYISYRQHSNNAIGGENNSGLSKSFSKIYRYLHGTNNQIVSRQATEFLNSFSKKISEEDLYHIKNLIRSKTLLQRVAYLFSFPFYRQRKIDTLATIIKMLSNKV